MSSSQLLDKIFPKGEIKRKKKDPDELVIEAVQKALDNTTPERPGTPWDKEKVVDGEETGSAVS